MCNKGCITRKKPNHLGVILVSPPSESLHISTVPLPDLDLNFPQTHMLYTPSLNPSSISYTGLSLLALTWLSYFYHPCWFPYTYWLNPPPSLTEIPIYPCPSSAERGSWDIWVQFTNYNTVCNGRWVNGFLVIDKWCNRTIQKKIWMRRQPSRQHNNFLFITPPSPQQLQSSMWNRQFHQIDGFAMKATSKGWRDDSCMLDI